MIFANFMFIYTVHYNLIVLRRPTKCTFFETKHYFNFLGTFYMTMFRTRVLVFNKTAVTRTGTAQYTLSRIRRTDCARAQFSGYSSTNNAYSKTGQMAVCCQNLTLGALSSRSALSLLFGALFKKSGLFLNTPYMSM
jgi:hypothetical protein